MIYLVTCGSGSHLAEVLLLAESAADALPAHRFVWLVSSSWSSLLTSDLQLVPGATVELWQPQRPVSAGTAANPEEIPQALLTVASRPDCTWALYCAPGVLWTSSPAEALGEASEDDVILVPTLLRSQSARGLPVCELEALQRGVFTHSFVAVRSSAEGRGFLGWWQKRLLEIPTQDRSCESWLNLAPALFPCVRVLRSLRFNVHRGNLHERRLDGSFPRVMVDGMPVVFFDLGISGDLPPAESEVDLQTRQAFRSVVDWREHRLKILAREGGSSHFSEI